MTRENDPLMNPGYTPSHSSGKGSSPRTSDKAKYDENYDRIFKKDQPKKSEEKDDD